MLRIRQHIRIKDLYQLGFTRDYLQKCIIDGKLVPIEWYSFTEYEQKKRLSDMDFEFSIEEIRRFITRIINENNLYSNLINQISLINQKLDELNINFIGFTELVNKQENFVDIDQMAAKLQKHPQTLRNNLIKDPEDPGFGIIRMKEFQIRVVKVAGRWIANRLDFEKEFARYAGRLAYGNKVKRR